jgi:Flp pilus assembly protein TadG
MSANNTAELGPKRRRRRHADRKGDDGLAEFVMVFPAFFIILLVIVQFALWEHASHMARAAAEQGVAAAAAYQAPVNAGPAAARSFINGAGPASLRSPQVTSSITAGDTATITVSGYAPALLGWMSLPVSSTSSEPVQRFRASG